MDTSCEIDALFLVCGAAAVPFAGYAIESLTRLPADGWRPVVVGVALVTSVLIVPPVIALGKAKCSPMKAYDACRLQAILQGRLVMSRSGCCSTSRFSRDEAAALASGPPFPVNVGRLISLPTAHVRREAFARRQIAAS